MLSAAAGLRIVRQDFDEARAQASEAMALCQEPGAAFDTARAEGRAMPIVQAIAVARQQALLLR